MALSLPQLGEVVRLLWSARLNWHNLGLELGIHETELQVIKANNPNDVEACFREMLSYWLKMTKPAPSYQALVEACSRPFVKCHELASEIAKKHDITLPGMWGRAQCNEACMYSNLIWRHLCKLIT